MHQDELLDLVNEKDEIIGTIWRNESHKLAKEDLGYIRAVEMFIVNSKGEFWIPKRTPDKRIAPNGLDFSVGGHVSSGESYIEAMLKETKEELGIHLVEGDIEYVNKIGPDKNKYFRQMYIYNSDTTPQFNPRDFVSAEWMDPRAAVELLESGVPAKSTLKDAIQIASDWLDSRQ